MKIVFITNYFNHHQSSFAEELNKQTNGNFIFIETTPMDDERKKMGWGFEKIPDYVKKMYISEEMKSECKKNILEADAVIVGSAPFYLVKERMKSKKIVFRYSERIYKKKSQLLQFFLRLIKYQYENFFNENSFLLCASAYAAYDYNKTFVYKNKSYKWGYFTKLKKYDDISLLINQKEKKSIIWVARLINLKHPELAIEMADFLKKSGIHFSLKIIGDGEMKKCIIDQIRQRKLEDCIEMLGTKSPDEVRRYMEKSEIFIFTSDFNEGWGAVLNEAMNSACAVVVSHAIGAVPFLIENWKNGIIYKQNDKQGLFSAVKWLLLHDNERKSFSKEAYYTILNHWNATIAVERLVKIIQKIQNNQNSISLYQDGPCSKAPILKNNWFKT